ncbi:FecR family protein [Dyadobacter aurulentus]|uniref:FecR family protein n=1 Tax=Dyadobacter sp. UC 10 TaxID=2605428 RepID=UPI001788B17E|nr:FecR domain-containing protein [Dyadobacter sp. UC 10]
MDKKSFRNLVKKYLRGETSEAENRWLEAYDRKLDREPGELLSHDKANLIEEDIANRLRQHIQAGRDRGTKSLWPVFRVAALIALTLGLGWFLVIKTQLFSGQKQVSQFTEIQVPYGKIKKLKLEDGTLVTLNAGSRFKYPGHFNADSREVWLQGEAYFDVSHQAGKPFLVSTRHVQVQVLGTRFNVNAFPENHTAQVSVAEGKVAVQDVRKRNEKLLLLAGDKADYVAENQSLTKTSIAESEVLAWQNGHLNFKNESFKNVAAALERRYAVKIEVDQAIADCRIYAQIGNDPVEKALEALTVLMQAKLSGGGKEFRFSGKQCQ